MSAALAGTMMGRKRRGVEGDPTGMPIELGSIKIHSDLVTMLRIIADAEDKSIAEIASQMLRKPVEARYEAALEKLQRDLKGKKKSGGTE